MVRDCSPRYGVATIPECRRERKTSNLTATQGERSEGGVRAICAGTRKVDIFVHAWHDCPVTNAYLRQSDVSRYVRLAYGVRAAKSQCVWNEGDGQLGERCSNCAAAQQECTYVREAKVSRASVWSCALA